MKKNMQVVEVNLYEELQKIVDQNTLHYKEDFDLDKKLIETWMQEPETKGEPLLWLSRKSGTYCFLEKDVFTKNTFAHECWCYWGEQMSDKVVAKRLHPKTLIDGQVFGVIENITYLAHINEVRRDAVTEKEKENKDNAFEF